MGKPTICICENKDADQVTAKLISVFDFATRVVQFLFYINPKFQASSSFLCLYWPVCVGPVWKPRCWFSHEAAQMIQVGLDLNNCNCIMLHNIAGQKIHTNTQIRKVILHGKTDKTKLRILLHVSR